MHASWVLGAVVFVVAPLPDLLPPGHRPVVHELVVQDDALFGQYRIVVGPLRGFHGLEEVEPDVPFTFSSKYGTKVYALPREAAMPSNAPRHRTVPEDWPEPYLTAEIPLFEVRSVPMVSPVERILTTLRFDGQTESSLKLAVVTEQRWSKGGGEVGGSSTFVLWGIALIGLVGLAVLWHKRPVPVEGA